VNLTRFHGVLAPNSKHRINVTPSKRGKGSAKQREAKVKKSAEQLVGGHKEMTCAQRLKRVFTIDITTCGRCSGPVKIIACIEDHSIIKKILDYLDAKFSTFDSATHCQRHVRRPKQDSSTEKHSDCDEWCCSRIELTGHLARGENHTQYQYQKRRK